MIQNFYILAMGRSGTTLLQNILDAHPGMVVPPETFFVLHLYGKYKGRTNWDDQTIKSFIDDVYTDRPFRLVWRVPRKQVEQAFERMPRPSNFAEASNVIRSSFRNSFENKALHFIGDKNPLYSRFTNRIMDVAPGAKIIHVVRDPRGTINSQIHSFKRNYALGLGYIWSTYNKDILRLKKRFPDQYYRLHYEDLILRPEDTVKDLCEFLNIPFADEMLGYREKMLERFDQYPDTLTGKHVSLLKPIDTKIMEKWKNSLSPKQVSQIEYSTWRMANQLGYSLSKPKANIRWWLPSIVARMMVRSGFFAVSVFFSMPFPVRKLILTWRSKLSDHKYWPEQHEQSKSS